MLFHSLCYSTPNAIPLPMIMLFHSLHPSALRPFRWLAHLNETSITAASSDYFYTFQLYRTVIQTSRAPNGSSWNLGYVSALTTVADVSCPSYRRYYSYSLTLGTKDTCAQNRVSTVYLSCSATEQTSLKFVTESPVCNYKLNLEVDCSRNFDSEAPGTLCTAASPSGDYCASQISACIVLVRTPCHFDR